MKASARKSEMSNMKIAKGDRQHLTIALGSGEVVVPFQKGKDAEKVAHAAIALMGVAFPDLHLIVWRNP